MGIALQKQNKLEEAIEAYNKVLVIKPDYADAYYNMGIALQEQNKLEEAIEAYNKALSFKPDYVDARTQKLHQQAHICNWDSIAEDVNLIPELGTLEKHVSPFALLSLEDSPDRHLTRSKIYAKAKYPQKILSPKDKPSKRPKRIRIGYFSTDFKEHPVAYLIAKVLEQHNRDKFEVCGYSIHGTSSCEMRQRLEKSFDSFTDVQSMSDKDISLRARQDKIDIAIDLNGYTQNSRTGVFAYRAAPIQINYLGYPGTLGADFMDYIVADPVLIPEDKRWHYSEQIIYMPNTYQPTDNTRIISDKVIMRKDIGLPDKGFVFCCFNQNCKISPAEFDIWMRLLTSVKGSVLWLLKSNKWAEQNLKRQAEAHGVSSERIIFAERVPQAEHLARQRLADLFLDTFNYNAHTTASDALWAGLPLVTKLGKGFAARVAGSLLNAVGLPELITKSEQDYEALILKLATNPTKLAEIKEKLANNRLTQPLFNTELYTKQLEEGYQQAYQNYFQGNLPKPIIVTK
jgi:predicted O-linked N-acetylglucosamine transferase (SPINDLY family)